MGRIRMTLVEKKIYFLNVGLFCYNWNEESALFGNGRMAIQGCPVMFDHADDGWYIFTVLENTDWYVRIPDNYVYEQVREVCFDGEDQSFIDWYKEYNRKIEEENGTT